MHTSTGSKLGIVSAATIVAISASAAIANDYRYDDGGNNITLGPPRSFAQFGDIDMLWGNYFETQESTEYITNVEFELGRISDNNQVTLWIFDDLDNDYDPTNASSLFSMTIDNPMTGFDGINSIDLGSIAVSGGFFVAISHLSELVYDDNNNPSYSSPARYDSDARADRSWFYYGSYGDLPDAGYHTRMDGPDVPIPGAFAVRATTSNVPTPGTLLIGSAGLLIAGRRRR